MRHHLWPNAASHAFVVPDKLHCFAARTLQVSTPAGHSFERAVIEVWVRQHQTCPLTRVPLALEELSPNRALQAAIEEYNESAHPSHSCRHISARLCV